MAWIELHATRIIRLKKFSDFRRAVGWCAHEALGFLGHWWGQTLEVCETGEVTGWTPDYLSELTGLGTQVSPKVWDALGSCGWIDKTAEGKLLIHHWPDWVGRFLRAKYSDSNRDRLVEIWALHGRTYGRDSGGDRRGSGDRRQVSDKFPTLPYPTLPDPTQEQMSERFEALWAKYPNKDGKKQALRHFLASVKTEGDWAAIQTALEKYMAHLRVNDWKRPKNGSTWFNNWKDWVSYEEPPQRGGQNGARRPANASGGDASRYAHLGHKTA